MFVLRTLARNLRAQPLRSFLSVFGIALGVATVVAIFTLDANTIAARLADKNAGRVRADLQVLVGATQSASDAELREAFDKVPGISRVAGSATAGGMLSQAEGEKAPVELIGASGQILAFGAFSLTEGAWWGRGWTSPREGSVPLLLGPTLAAERGWGIGTNLLIEPPPRRSDPIRRCEGGQWIEEERRVRPAGELPEPVPAQVVGLLEDFRFGSRAGGRVAIVPLSQLAKVRDVAGVDRTYWIQREEGADIAELSGVLRLEFPELIIDPSITAVVGEDPDERAFRNGVRVAGILALVLGLFVIFHALSIALLQRMREVAILIALGLTRGAVARLFLLEAAILSAVGVTLGLALGLGLARLLLVTGITTLGIHEGGVQLFRVPWGQVLTLAGLGFALALAGAAHPLWRSRRWSPHRLLSTRDLPPQGPLFAGVDLFFAGVLLICVPLLYFFTLEVVGQDAERVLVIFLGGLAAFCLLLAALHFLPWVLRALVGAALLPWARWFPLERDLVRRNMELLFGRVAVGVSGLALVAAALVTLRGMTTSLSAEVRTFAAEAYEGKLFVEIMPLRPNDSKSVAQFRKNPLTRERLNAFVAEHPEVLGYEQSSMRLFAPFSLRALDPEQARWGPLANDPALRRAYADASRPGIFISKRLAAFQPELVRSGTLRLPARNRAGAVEVRILGATDAYGMFHTERIFAVASPEFFRLFQCMDPEQVGSFVLKLSDGASADAVERALRDDLGADFGLMLSRGAEKRAFELADIDRDFFLFDVILLLVAALASLGLLHSLWIAALERRREMAILKALGFTPGQIRLLVSLEAATTGGLGGLFGLLLGVPLLALVLAGLRELSGLDLPFTWPWVWMIVAFFLATLLGLLAGLLPAWRVARLAPAPHLRGE